MLNSTSLIWQQRFGFHCCYNSLFKKNNLNFSGANNSLKTIPKKQIKAKCIKNNLKKNYDTNARKEPHLISFKRHFQKHGAQLKTFKQRLMLNAPMMRWDLTIDLGRKSRAAILECAEEKWSFKYESSRSWRALKVSTNTLTWTHKLTGS